MSTTSLLESLRSQDFYGGQILRVRMLEAKPAEVCSLRLLFERVPRLQAGSLPRILSVLGFEEVYASHLGGLKRAFPEEPGETEDTVLMAPVSDVRELFWQLVCFAEALDDGRGCLVLCPDEQAAKCAHGALESAVERADIRYALEFATITEGKDLSVYQNSLPLISVFTPETLRALLRGSELAPAREKVLAALGRVAIPCLDDWPPPLAAHTAFLLRELHLECALRGTYPALVGTASPVRDLAAHVGSLWGKHIDGRAIVATDSVESPAACFISYTGSLLRDPSNPREWIRQAPTEVASELLGWLVGRHTGKAVAGKELHYVLDVSGSMTAHLPSVRAAVVADLKMKLDAGTLAAGDRVKLTVFETEATEVFSQEVTTSLLGDFRQVIEEQQGGGGTDIPLALGAALESALKEEGTRAIYIVLFSDGYSPIAPETRRRLLHLTREARVAGRIFRLLYVVLEMEPPAETRNLVHLLGGTILRQSVAELEDWRSFDFDDLDEGWIVLWSGERGLPEDIIQPFQAGRRQIAFTRSIARLSIPPKDVVAVVASGRFGSLEEIRNEVGHLGRESLPVFVLTEAEAWAQVISEDFPEARALQRIPLAYSENPFVAATRLRDCLGARELEAAHFRYLLEGASGYDRLMRALKRSATAPATSATTREGRLPDLPVGIESVLRDEREWARLTDFTPNPHPDRLATFTQDAVALEGSGILQYHDAAIVPISFHPGSIVDSGDKCAEVDSISSDRVVLKGRTPDRQVPILVSPTVQPLQTAVWDGSSRRIDGLGTVQWGHATFAVDVKGIRRYPLGNLDDRSRDHLYREPVKVRLDTVAMLWKPDGAPPEVLVGLANTLRLTVNALFRQSEQTLLVFPESSTIWLVDLSPGGNGVAAHLDGNPELLQSLLALGGRIALECPCEGGFAGASTADKVKETDNGCPRCSRVIGAVVLDGDRDRFAGVSKKGVLQWLLSNRHLPSSADIHIKEKYEGVNDPRRISGGDEGSRRGCLRLARSVLSDRLGLEIDDSMLASFEWLGGGGTFLGQYESGRNVISIVRDLKEWQALDVCAHEYFHNLQYKLAGLFEHARLGHDASPKPPVDGKLFIEGSAMWAESHVVDALAIRSSLDLANLRQGDEYGEGFQLIKHIEENCGGVRAVLTFLSTGDIQAASGGTIRDMKQLYSLVGASDDSVAP